MDEPDEYGHFPKRTDVVVTDPLGTRVQVTVTAPRNGLWDPALIREAGEIAAQAAHQVVDRINTIRNEKAMECPF